MSDLVDPPEVSLLAGNGRPLVSTVIVSWNTRDLLRACLESMREATREIEGAVEVVVVDNASHDGTPDMVSQEFPEVDLIRNAANHGFAAANNQGIRRSKGRYVLLLNPDTEGRAGFLHTLVSFMERHPDAGAVGPRVIGARGEHQVSCYPLPTLGRELWRLFHLDAVLARGIYPPSLFESTTPQRVESMLGACLLVRRQALQETGLLDERFFIYTEEIDLCRRLGDRDWQLFWVPAALIVHYGGASTTQVALRMFVELYRSKVQYFRKHFGRSGAIGYKAVLAAAALPRVGMASIGLALQPSQRPKWRALLTNYSALLAQLPAL